MSRSLRFDPTLSISISCPRAHNNSSLFAKLAKTHIFTPLSYLNQELRIPALPDSVPTGFERLTATASQDSRTAIPSFAQIAALLRGMPRPTSLRLSRYDFPDAVQFDRARHQITAAMKQFFVIISESVHELARNVGQLDPDKEPNRASKVRTAYQKRVGYLPPASLSS
jgi:hypothetical protein